MGGRSSSSAGRGSGGGATRVGNVDLRDFPLRYGGKDSNFSDATRDKLDKFERQHYRDQIENQVMLDENGNIIATNKGDSGHVSYSTEDARKATTTSHNHPRPDSNKLGGTFSSGDPDDDSKEGGGDIKGFVWFSNQKTKRATAKEGTYSISKQDGFEGHAFLRSYNQESNRGKAAYIKELQDLNNKYHSIKNPTDKDYKTYRDNRAKAFNRWMVRNHNWLLDNQKKYHYYYTLERRN